MTKIDKLIERLLSVPGDFTYGELTKILNFFGYEEVRRGKTAGSRSMFVRNLTGHVIRLHKPHPKPILKRYMIRQIIEELKKEKLI